MFEKKEYQAVNKVLNESLYSTMSGFNLLQKIAIRTHDLKLKEKVTTFLKVLLQEAFLRKKGMEKDIPMEADGRSLTERRMDELLIYCNGMIETKIPIWRIIAAQHGWGEIK